MTGVRPWNVLVMAVETVSVRAGPAFLPRDLRERHPILRAD